METTKYANKLDYGEWVWYGFSGHQLVPLILLENVTDPSLGTGIRWFGHSIRLIWVLIFLYAGGNGGDLHELIGKILIQPLIVSMVFIIAIYHGHTSHHIVFDLVVGDREREKG